MFFVPFPCKVLMKWHMDESQAAHKEEYKGECDKLTKDAPLDVININESLVEWDQRVTEKHLEGDIAEELSWGARANQRMGRKTEEKGYSF